MNQPALQLFPHIHFNGNCRNAMEFYQQCFGGEITYHAVAQSKQIHLWKNFCEHLILQARLSTPNFVLLGTDIDLFANAGKACCLSVECVSAAQVEHLFNQLTTKAEVIQPLYNYSNNLIGSLRDQFGITWIINYMQTTFKTKNDEKNN